MYLLYMFPFEVESKGVSTVCLHTFAATREHISSDCELLIKKSLGSRNPKGL